MGPHGPPDPGAWAVLDIGGDVGAVLLTTGAGRDGTEIELRRLGTRDESRTHAGVHPRRTARGLVHAALYPALPAGAYELLLGTPGDPDNPRVIVRGGAVTTLQAG